MKIDRTHQSFDGLLIAQMVETHKKGLTRWQQWLEHPERLLVRRIVFQVHLWVGAIASAYLLLMSASGSAIVFRNELAGNSLIEWLVRLHTDLLTGTTGRFVNGIGGGCLTVLCLTGAMIWWPGTRHWRRSLTVDWSGHFARITWDLHSALGFWLFPFVLLWGVSGFYFAFPDPFNVLYTVNPGGRFANFFLDWLSNLHFGRFGWFIQTLWVLFGLVPAILAFTGVFICCRRVIFKKPSNPRSQ
jgi:uncharacterized iron-regulated membrane protein